jgi:hypothetical protein
VTSAEFVKLFPGRAFAARYVERGDKGARAFVWHVMFTNDYWTSDSDRDVYNHCPPREPDGFGPTLEAAFDDVARNWVGAADRQVAMYRVRLTESEQEARELKERLGR